MTYSMDEWSTIDAGGVGDADLYDIIDGRPPEVTSPPPLFYTVLDPDAPENQLAVSAWTKLWYSNLPTFLKSADEVQNPESGGWPMLRFMDAAGHIADGVRATVHDMYEGVWTDPTTVPDRAVGWLASVLGVPASQKNVPLPQLREALVNMVENGKSPVGTRAELANATKQFLTGTKVVAVRAAAEVRSFLTPTDEALVNAMGLASVRGLYVGPQSPEVETVHRWTGAAHGSASEQLRRGTFVAENLVHNPRFEVDLTGWVTDADATMTRDTTVKETGAASAKITPTAADWYWIENYRTGPGTGEYVLRMRVFADVSRVVQLRCWQYDGGSSQTSEQITLTAGVWQWVSMTFTLTDTAHRYRVSMIGGPLDADTTPVWVDRVYTARSEYAVMDYFDGDSPDSAVEDVWVDSTARVGHTWDSGANAWTAHVGSEAQAGAVVDEREAGDMIRAHTVQIVVRSDQVPNGDLEALAANLRTVGVVPAGHSLMIVTAQPTWDTFEARMAELGGTWADYERATRVWTDDESMGLADF